MDSPCGHRCRTFVRTGLALLFLLALPLVSSENVSQHQTNQIERQTAPPDQDPVPLGNDFDWTLAKEVFRRDQRNSIFSPFSVKLLLTLLYEAAGQNSTTKRELSQALVGVNLEKNRQVYQEFLDSSTKENKDYKFNIGTRVFLDRSLANVTDSYAELVQRCYRTEIEKVSFSNAAVTAAQVNDWCSNITHGQLGDLVTQDQIQDAAMIIANVLFLKASWRISFDEDKTRKRSFHISQNQNVEVDFMEQTDIYSCLDDPELQLQMVRLPYKGRLFSMVIVLPYPNRSLDETVDLLTNAKLLKLESNLKREEYVIVMPKFKFDHSLTLNEILPDLGISEIFTRKASLPQLSGGKESTLAVSKILQKAGIEVNEKGTLAVAATEIQLVNKFGIDDSPTEFIIDRPFLFYIKDVESDAMLFMGKVHNPALGTMTPVARKSERTF